MDEVVERRVFAINYRKLDCWDVAYFRFVNWRWPKELIRPIGTALYRIQKIVTTDLLATPIIEKISFGGELTILDTEKRARYKGRLFKAESGQLIYSKIRVKQGSACIVPSSIDWVAVSSEYPVYEIDLSIANPAYLELVLRSSAFKYYLEGLSHGGSTKTRIHPDLFKELLIPIPPLPIQQKIVSHWETAQASLSAAKMRVSETEKEIQKRFLTDLGLPEPKHSTPSKYFAAKWKVFERWSVSYNQAFMSAIDLTLGRFPVVELGSILEMVQYGTSEKANTTEKGTPVLRMNNIKDGYLDFSNLKHISLQEKTRKSLLLMEGDILINRTNSKELVGKSAVFHGSDEYVFASYLIRVRLEKDQAIPDYVAYCINSIFGRQQIDALSRQIIGQANINSQELRSLYIPLPPLDVQREIMKRIEVGRSQIVQQLETVNHLHYQTQIDIERMILGTQPIEEN